MCNPRQESTTTECITVDDSDSMVRWLLTTVFLWLGVMVAIWLIYTCSADRRRRRVLDRTLVPLLALLGLKATYRGTAREQDTGDQPPSYELAVISYSNPSMNLPITGPPSYEEATGRTLHERDVSSVHDPGNSGWAALRSNVPVATMMFSSARPPGMRRCHSESETRRLESESCYVDGRRAPLVALTSGLGTPQDRVTSSTNESGEGSHLPETAADTAGAPCRTTIRLLSQHSSAGSLESVETETSPCALAEAESENTTHISSHDVGLPSLEDPLLPVQACSSIQTTYL